MPFMCHTHLLSLDSPRAPFLVQGGQVSYLTKNGVITDVLRVTGCG